MDTITTTVTPNTPPQTKATVPQDDLHGQRTPREIIRQAAAKWYVSRMEAMSGFDDDDVCIHIRTLAARCHRNPMWPVNEPFRRHITEVLAFVPPLTVEEQHAVEQYLVEYGNEAALTIQLALG